MRKIILLGLSLIAIVSCAPRRDDVCSGNSMKHCEPSVYFDFDSTRISHVRFSNLNWVIEKLKRWPDRVVVLKGNADLIGERKYNEKLSKNRALVIGKVLVDRGVDPKRIKIKALGSHYPITHERKLQHLNRRVDITFEHKSDGFLDF